MAKESSFDIVSIVDIQEADNAFQQTKKELQSRYDLKDTKSSIDFDKAAKMITVHAPSDFVIGQIIDILSSKWVKRGLDLAAISWNDTRDSAQGTSLKEGKVVEGIDKDIASKINKDIKAEKFKAKVQIEGDKLRVSSASRDVLQEIIAFVKQQNYGIPLQFNNYR